MPLTTYYFEGLDFAAATTLYTDALMSVVAPDGYYSGGGIVRRQVSGLLLTAVTCPGCFILCGNPQGNAVVSLGSDVGRMELKVDSGSVIGLMMIEFSPGLKPTKLTWSIEGGVSDSVGLYSSQVEGFVTGFVGSEAGGITNIAGSGGVAFPGFDYNWNSTSLSWEQSTAYTIPAFSAGGCTLVPSTNNMKECYLPIPITVANSIVTITIENCLTTPEWTVDIPCPRLITPALPSTAVQANEPNACAASITTTIYRGKVSTAVEIGVDDWVFSDNTGSTKLDDGVYGVTVTVPTAGQVAVEVSNGVVLSISDPCGD